MRLLLFSDLHVDVVATRKLAERAKPDDIAVCAGDLANCRRQLTRCLDILRNLTCPLILVPGNNESFDELQSACEGWPQTWVLHKTGTTVREIRFFGLGGGIPTTPFGAWSFDLTEDEADAALAACESTDVLVTHSPPRGIVDVNSHGKCLGSVSIRRAIARIQPKLLVCGHIHASAGQQAQCGPTTVINAGPGGMEFTLI